MEAEAEKHIYPKDSGKYNIKVDEEGFYERGLDENDIEIEYVPLPRDMRKDMDREDQRGKHQKALDAVSRRKSNKSGTKK